jgi:hypothetical protein
MQTDVLFILRVEPAGMAALIGRESGFAAF